MFYKDFEERRPVITISLLILQAGSQRISDSCPLAVTVFLHLPYLIFHHTLDFVAHGFPAGLTEMKQFSTPPGHPVPAHHRL